MNDTIEKRKAYVIKEIKYIALIGFSYFVFVSITGIYIPCIFRLVSGYKCPGCGISHMFVKMSHLDFVGAYHENQFVFVLLPIALIYGGFKAYKYIYKGKVDINALEMIVITILCVLAILFAVYRNTFLI